AVLLDSESTFDQSFATLLGVDVQRMLFVECPTLEDGFVRIEKFIDTYADNELEFPTVIIWDTLAAAPTKRELEEGTYSGGIAGKPRGVSEFLRKITHRLAQQKIALVIVNQLRSSLGEGPDDSPGGKALRHHASLRLLVKTSPAGQFIREESNGV